MHRQQTSLIFVSWLSVWRWRGAREIRIALNSTIIALICLSSERTLSHLLDKLSSKWAGPYTRRLSCLLDSSSSRWEWPIYPISCRVNGPGPWAVRVNGSKHIDELIITGFFGKYQNITTPSLGVPPSMDLCSSILLLVSLRKIHG